MNHPKTLAFAFILVCDIPCLAVAGEFFRETGKARVNDGGKQITITISATPVAEGQLSPTVTRSGGNETTSTTSYQPWNISQQWEQRRNEITSRTSYQHLKPKAWFAFVESASGVWLFDGKQDLAVLLMNGKDWTLAEAADPAAPVDLKDCPQEVLQALPDETRKKYFIENAADSFSPSVPLERALVLAKAYVQETNVDTSKHYLKSIELKFDDKGKSHHWEAQWMSTSRSTKGDRFIIRVDMDKTISLIQGK